MDHRSPKYRWSTTTTKETTCSTQKERSSPGSSARSSASLTHSGNLTYKIFLDNRTIDTKPDAAINYFISDNMLGKEYVFILEYGRIIGFQRMPYQPSETTTKE